MIAVKQRTTQRNRDWWHDSRNTLVLIDDMLRNCDDDSERVMVVQQITSKPWNWYIEWVVADCRRRDSR